MPPRGLLCLLCRESRAVRAARDALHAVLRMQRTLGVLFVCQFMWAYAYFIATAVIVQALTRNAGLTDVQAGIVYSAYGLLLSVYGTITGFVVDNVGVFEVIVVGAAGGVVGRGLLAALLVADGLAGDAAHLAACLVLLATVVPASDALVGQVIGLGVKRYTGPALGAGAGFEDAQAPEPKRGTEYALSYALQNVSSMLAFGTIAALNAAYPADEAAVNRGALIAAVPALVAALCAAAYGARIDTFNVDVLVADRVDAQLAEENNMEEEAQLDANEERLGVTTRRLLRAAEGGCCARCLALCVPLRVKRWTRSLRTASMGILARFIVMALLLVPVKMLFRHFDATLPKYTQRAFDPNYSYALLELINPLLCIALSVPIGAALHRFGDYWVIVAGTTLCCAAVALAMVPAEGALVAFIVFFTLGEIVWSPRLQAYFYALAPRGEEGAFGAIAAVPAFLAKLPVGLLSGAMLERFCPAYGACDSWALWGVIGAFSLVTPLALAGASCWLAVRVDAHMHAVLHASSRRSRSRGSFSTDGNGVTVTVVELDMMTPRQHKD